MLRLIGTGKSSEGYQYFCFFPAVTATTLKSDDQSSRDLSIAACPAVLHRYVDEDEEAGGFDTAGLDGGMDFGGE